MLIISQMLKLCSKVDQYQNTPYCLQGTLGVPVCIHTRTKNVCWKSKKCVCSVRSVLDLTKLGVHSRLGNILASAHGGVGCLQSRGHVFSFPSSSSILQHFKVLHLSSHLFCHLRASPSSSSILQHLKVNKRLQTLISQQLYTQSLYSIHIQ